MIHCMKAVLTRWEHCHIILNSPSPFVQFISKLNNARFMYQGSHAQCISLYRKVTKYQDDFP